MQKILIRCDAGKVSEVGTGHLARCITICRYLISKYKIKKKNFIFLTKTKKRFAISEEILRKEKFNYIAIPNKIKDYSSEELEIIKKINPKITIIDRLGVINKKFLLSLKKLSIKSILIDDKSNIRKKSNLYLNPLVFEKKKIKFQNQGFNYSIFPSILFAKKK